MTTRKYELSFWLSSDLTESEAESLFNDIIKKIETEGGQVLSTQIPQLKTMSYPIKKETNGYFSFVQFSGDEIKLEELTKSIKLNKKILRFSLVRIPEFKQKIIARKIKQVLTSNKSERPLKEPSVEMTIEELDQKLNEILKE